MRNDTREQILVYIGCGAGYMHVFFVEILIEQRQVRK